MEYEDKQGQQTSETSEEFFENEYGVKGEYYKELSKLAELYSDKTDEGKVVLNRAVDALKEKATEDPQYSVVLSLIATFASLNERNING